MLIVHNRYRRDQPSGENSVVDEELAMLTRSGCDASALQTSSDEISAYSPMRRIQLGLDVVWSRRGYELVSREIRRRKPDAVHIHNTFPLLSPSAIWAAARADVPVVHTLHNFRSICASSDFLRDGQPCEQCLHGSRLSAVVHGCYRGSRLATLPLTAMSAVHTRLGTWTSKVNVFICPSEFAREKYVEAGWPRDKLEVKYNTASDTAPLPPDEREFVLGVGRFTPEKGFDTLIRAWRHAGLVDERLVLVGSGEMDAQLRELARGTSNIEFAGQLSLGDTLSMIARAKILIVPSRCYELFPRVIAEAYSRGVSVIAGRIGSLPEVVEDGKTGRLVAVDDEHDLSRVLQETISSGSWRAFGVAARARFDHLYSPTKTTNRLLEIYSGVIGGG